MTRPAWLLGSALAAMALLASARAQAQNVKVTNPTTTRQTPDAGVKLPRSSVNEYFISYQDCIDDIELDFPVAVTGSTNGFQVWASATADCTVSATRNQSPQVCFNFAPSYPSQTGKVTIKARALLDTLFGIGSDCIDTSGNGSQPRPLTIYFMLIPDSGDVDSTNVYKWDKTQIDLLGPEPPTDMTLGVGNGELILNLPTNMNSDTQGYFIFCWDRTTDGFTTSSGTTTSSTTSSTTSTTSTTSSTATGTGGAMP